MDRDQSYLVDILESSKIIMKYLNHIHKTFTPQSLGAK